MKPILIDGFTLIELMVVISVIAISLTFGIPSYKYMMQKNQLAAGSNRLISALNLARSEAIKRGRRVSVRKIGAGWENGWQVFIDNPPSGTQEKEDTVLQVYQALQKGYTFRGNNNFSNYISYLPNGQSNNAVGGSFAICDNADGSNIPHKNSSRLIIINGTGRVRVGIDKDNNGIPDKEDGANLTSCINP